MIGHANLPIAVKWVQCIIYWFRYKVFNSALDVEFQVHSTAINNHCQSLLISYICYFRHLVFKVSISEFQDDFCMFFSLVEIADIYY